MSVCENNITLLENNYKNYLEHSKIEDSEIQFKQYLNHYSQKVCPENGNIFYIDGKIFCTIHAHIKDDYVDEPVPYL